MTTLDYDDAFDLRLPPGPWGGGTLPVLSSATQPQVGEEVLVVVRPGEAVPARFVGQVRQPLCSCGVCGLEWGWVFQVDF